MRLFVMALFLLCAPAIMVQAQNMAGDEANAEYRYLIDMPTSGVLDKGFVSVSSDILPGGLMVAKLDVGVFQNLSFGISYGGGNIIGSGKVDWYKYPGVNIRYKFFEESLAFPSLTVGFDSQGKGEYFDKGSRYAIKSPGFFVAGSKNFEMLGYLSLHGVVNYSLENSDGDNFLNLMVGAEKTIGSKVSLIAEYNFAFNDNGSKVFGKGNGYFNLGVRWAVSEGFVLGFDLRDLFDNKTWAPSTADRAIRFEFVQKILN